MSTTFRQLDRESSGVSSTKPSSLETWYDKVRDTPISDMSIDDLCRACRQEIHLAHVLPVVFERLRNDPVSGAMFDGELASVVARISLTFWRQHEAYAESAREVLRSVFPRVESDIRKEIDEFLTNK